MYFSGKITNSIFDFLQREGVEFSDIYELSDIPEQILKDPTSWIEANKVEEFLQAIERNFTSLSLGQGVLVRIGHEAKDLKSWGVLDSVLRMIDKPMDVISQPQRVVSYFVSPSPPVANLTCDENSVTFDLPISFEEYPSTCTYLTASFEALPAFMGYELAESTWKSTQVRINAGVKQSQFLEESFQSRQMAPEFVESLIDSLEKTERALEEKSREVERIRQENEAAAKSKTQDLEKWFLLYRNFNRYTQEVLRLKDYFTRSQQLVTLLIGQDRVNAQVKEAMRRVNWEQVLKNYPGVIQGLLDDFEAEKQTWNPEAALNGKHQESPRQGDLGQSWLPHN